MAVGDLLSGMAIPMENPGVDPQQMPKFEENKSLWRSMMDRVRTDPNMQQALLSAGIGMLRSPGFGQSGWDVTANALASGLGTFQQGRQLDTQNRMAQAKLGLEEQQVGAQVKKTDSDIKTGEQNANTYAAVGAEQVAASQAKTTRDDATTQLANSLAPRETTAKETSARADMIRSNAYATQVKEGKGSTGQNVALVNQRKQALMSLNPGMSDEEATIKAQNDILLTAKSGGNIANIATTLFKTNLEAWQNSFDNLGKDPTPEILEQLKQRSMQQAKEFGKLNGTPTTATSGTINRGTPPLSEPALPPDMQASADAAVRSLVGKKVAGADGSFAEIVSEGPGTVTIRLPNGRSATLPLDQVAPHIITE